MRASRQLHLRGALGAPRTEMWEGREHLVVPMVALMEGVIHAVNAKTAEFVPAAALAASVNKWKGHPIVIGHPVRDGHQISAHDPEVLAKHGCGFIRQAEMKGTKLGMEALIDPARLEKLGRHQLLADLRAGKGCEVSVGAFVTTNDKRSAFNGKSYEGEWLEIGPDHTALLPDGIGACSIAMGCGAHRAAEGAYLVTAAGFEALSNPEGINQYSGISAEDRQARVKEIDKKIHEVTSQGGGNSARDVKRRMQVIGPLVAEQEQHMNALDPSRHQAIAASAKLNAKENGGYDVHHAGEKIGTLDPVTFTGFKAVNSAQQMTKREGFKATYGDKVVNAQGTRKEGIEAIARAHSAKLKGLSGHVSKGLSMKSLKARILALFDTPEQAASEEAAELVAYNSMRVLFDGVGDQWDEASGLIDDLISDETDDPTQTPAEEQAEEEVEAARLDSIRTIAYTMINTLQNLVSATYACQAPDLPEPADPRYAEALRALVGARNSAADMEHIQGMHDSAMALGAKCDRANAMRSLANPEGVNQYTAGTAAHSEATRVVKQHAQALSDSIENEGNHWPADKHEAANGLREALDKHAKTLSLGLPNDAKKIREDVYKSREYMTKNPYAPKEPKKFLRDAAAKDCPECDGTGQVTKDDKQSDCASCDGTGVLKTAELKAACRCAEADVNKTERIAALLKNEHNPIKDLKALEANTDEGLRMLEVHCENAAKLKVAADKLQADKDAAEAKLKAAAEKQLTEEEFLKTAPESIRTLVADKKAQDAAHKTALIATLKVAAKGVYSDEELAGKTIDELTKLTQLAKVDAPATDYSGRAIPTPRAAAGEDYTPPDPYKDGVAQLKAASQVN
jgi:hypothetical protein